MAEEAKGGNNKGMMMIIMAMLGLIIVALVGVSIFLITSLGNDDDDVGGVGAFVPDPPLTAFDIVTLDIGRDVTTNLLPRANGSRHFVVLRDLSLGINNLDEDEAIDFAAEIRAREAVVIDTINTILRRTTPEELEAEGGGVTLSENILQALQTAFGSHMIVDVYFQFAIH
ncbi:MAG: flagellar basal body-associated FliL family protein [Defluviitaleaceae bacterium]|nr:flagellar basal body-associated FliL family protein [Defluviitaleaceae bacterium]